jgi:serine/threonine-protein kinase RsbW
MPSLQFEFTCDLVQVPSAGQKLHSFLAANGCSQTEAADCELALVEACNNAIQHSRPEQRREPVRVQALCATKQIELRVIDHTAGFDWPDQARLPDVDRENGRGIFLIKSLMDSSEYLQAPGENTLILRKARAQI